MRFCLIAGVLLFGLGVSECVSARAEGVHGMPSKCDNQRFLDDQNDFVHSYGSNVITPRFHVDKPAHVCGTVVRVFRARKSRSGWHGFFLLAVGNGRTVRVVANLDEMNAPAWPWVKADDPVEVQGRYYYDSPRHQGIDWTHHGSSRHWPWSGFVIVHGQTYN